MARLSGGALGGICEPVSAPIIVVALDLPLDKTFDFLGQDETVDDIGRIVIVPFGPRKLVGVIVGIGSESAVALSRLKAVIHVQRKLPKFSARDFTLFRFCQQYYHSPFGVIALNALPPAMRVAAAIESRPERSVAITLEGRIALDTARAMPKRAATQAMVLAAVVDLPQAESVLKLLHPRAAAVLTVLAKKGLVEFTDVLPPIPAAGAAGANIAVGPTLTEQQRQAIHAVNAARGTFQPFLLFGVTASGKTEVYLQVIANALKHGQQALVLVPEINLTPQFFRQVKARFPGAHIVLQNSSLAGVPRLSGYLDALAGRADIVVGTRLAVFTPMPRLGVIIIDEEHDASFKQQEGFRYSARDVAIFRAQQEPCAVVMGSATPSLESVQNVARGRFKQLAMTTRAITNAFLPYIDFIDMRRERTEDGLSRAMISNIAETVQRGEQALLFINRRGFSPALVCAQCGSMPDCTRCSARLVFHREARRLKCHHCGYQAQVPSACTACGSLELTPAGQGSERIEAALREKLPSARIVRVDQDSTRKRGAAERIFAAAARGEIDVLVGTQMLSKGHDFPKITLVGVVNADSAMFSADFRAAERMVAQLCQVAGRAGRADLPGRVLIQTRFPTHPLYQAVAKQDHARFAEIAMAERKSASLPPYSFLALLRAESKTLATLNAFMREVVAAASATRESADFDGVHVWDPVPATLAKKADYQRQQLMIQANARSTLQQFLTAWLPQVRAAAPSAVNWLIDVDPLDV